MKRDFVFVFLLFSCSGSYNFFSHSNFPISDGLGRSGTFCALYSVLERLKIEQVVDVFQAIKAMRIPRPGLVKTTVGKWHRRAKMLRFTFCSLPTFNMV